MCIACVQRQKEDIRYQDLELLVVVNHQIGSLQEEQMILITEPLV